MQIVLWRERSVFPMFVNCVSGLLRVTGRWLVLPGKVEEPVRLIAMHAFSYSFRFSA